MKSFSIQARIDAFLFNFFHSSLSSGDTWLYLAGAVCRFLHLLGRFSLVTAGEIVFF